jgi:hypothetical protein
MPKFRVLKKSFINNSLVEEGTVIDYDGKPSDNLEAIDPPAQELVASAAGDLGPRGIDPGDIVRQTMAAAGGDPDAVDASIVASAAAASAQRDITGQSAAGLV